MTARLAPVELDWASYLSRGAGVGNSVDTIKARPCQPCETKNQRSDEYELSRPHCLS